MTRVQKWLLWSGVVALVLMALYVLSTVGLVLLASAGGQHVTVDNSPPPGYHP